MLAASPGNIIAESDPSLLIQESTDPVILEASADGTVEPDPSGDGGDTVQETPAETTLFSSQDSSTVPDPVKAEAPVAESSQAVEANQDPAPATQEKTAAKTSAVSQETTAEKETPATQVSASDQDEAENGAVTQESSSSGGTTTAQDTAAGTGASASQGTAAGTESSATEGTTTGTETNTTKESTTKKEDSTVQETTEGQGKANQQQTGQQGKTADSQQETQKNASQKTSETYKRIAQNGSSQEETSENHIDSQQSSGSHENIQEETPDLSGFAENETVDEDDTAALPGMDQVTLENGTVGSTANSQIISGRTLNVDMVPMSEFTHEGMEDEQYATNQLWHWLFDRGVTLSRSEGADLSLEITGDLPADVTATAGYLVFDEEDIYSETGIAAIDVMFTYANGKEYIPNTPLRVSVSGSEIGRVSREGTPYFMVYAHDEYNAAEGLIVDESELTSYVTVFRELPQTADEARNEYWTKRSEQLRYNLADSTERVSFYEDSGSLSASDQSIEFLFPGDAPLRFVISFQRPERTIEATTDGIPTASAAVTSAEAANSETIATSETATSETAESSEIAETAETSETVETTSAGTSSDESLTNSATHVSVTGYLAKETTLTASSVNAADYAAALGEDGIFGVNVALNHINRDGQKETYQPDHFIQVTLANEALGKAIASGSPVTVWNLTDPATPVVVEDITLDGNSVTFDTESVGLFVVTGESKDGTTKPEQELQQLQELQNLFLDSEDQSSDVVTDDDETKDATSDDSALDHNVDVDNVRSDNNGKDVSAGTDDKGTGDKSDSTKEEGLIGEETRGEDEAFMEDETLMNESSDEKEGIELINNVEAIDLTQTESPVEGSANLVSEQVVLAQTEEQTRSTETELPAIVILDPAAVMEHDTETETETESEIETETESEIVIETETETEVETESETGIETVTEADTELEDETESETQIETEDATEAETQTETEDETEAETQLETEDETEPETENVIDLEGLSEEELLYRLLRVKAKDGTALVSVSGMMPIDVKADVQTEDAQAYSEDLEGEGFLALDISLPRTNTNGEEEDKDTESETETETETEALPSGEDETVEKYQPEEPVRVIITDSKIGEAQKNDVKLEVWHTADDGTKTKVENVHFVGSSAVFYADSFSVYTVTLTILRPYN